MLRLFLKDRVTLKTGVNAAENSALYHRNKSYFKIYCNIKVILHFYIKQY